MSQFDIQNILKSSTLLWIPRDSKQWDLSLICPEISVNVGDLYRSREHTWGPVSGKVSNTQVPSVHVHNMALVIEWYLLG